MGMEKFYLSEEIKQNAIISEVNESDYCDYDEFAPVTYEDLKMIMGANKFIQESEHSEM